MNQALLETDYLSMKDTMNKLIKETELSRIVDQQDAKIRKKERQIKKRRLKL